MLSALGWSRDAAGVRGFFAPWYTPGVMRKNLASAAVTTVSVVICCLMFGPQLGMISLMGTLTPFWETGRPLWGRIRNSLLVPAALTASMAAGVLVAPYHWAIAPATALIIMAIGVLYHAFMLTPAPSPVMLFYSAVIGTFFGADQRVGWQAVGVAAFAAVLTSVLLLVPLLFGVRRPEELAVAAAGRAVSAYEDMTGADGQMLRVMRNRAFQAVNSAWLTLQSAWPADRGRRHEMLAAELMQANRGLARAVLARLGMDPELRPLTATPLQKGRPNWRFLLSHALRNHSVEWFISWRIGAAAGIAGIVSQLIGIGHPYWAIFTATIVINQWMDRIAATRRAVQRATGTLLGVGVVWAVSATDPSPWWTVVAVLVCAVCQYLAFPLNYALALMFVTPMALLAVQAGGTGEAVATITFDRFIDTLIGSMAAVAVTWATSWYFPRHLVRSQSVRSIAAIAAVEKVNDAGDPFSEDGRRARIELEHELIHHLSILDRAVADDPRLADLAPAEHVIADRGYAALGRAWQARPGVANSGR